MTKTQPIALIAITVLLTSCGGKPTPPAQSVLIETARIETITDSISYPATVQAISTVELLPRIEGYLEKINFTEGQMVNEGDLLYIIEPYQYAATVAQNEANLANAKAVLTERTLNVERYRILYAEKVVSASTKDQAESDYYQALANVEAAKAELINAELNLSYTEIFAPMTGQIGATRVYAGDYLAPGSNSMATIVQLDPIRVVFSLTEKQYLDFTLAHDDIKTYLKPTLQLSNGTLYEHSGEIDFIDNHVNSNTGAIAFYAKFPNTNQILLPGQFVTVFLQEGIGEEAITVPAASVLFDKDGHYVLLVDKDSNVLRRDVKIGTTLNTRIEITDGLQEGEKVIIEGIQKIMPGMPVKASVATEKGGA